MYSSIRFYFTDPKTNEEITPAFTNVFEGTGRSIGTVKGLTVRDEIFVGRNGQRVTIEDFPGRETVRVKFWHPDTSLNEFFYLSSAETLQKYGLN